MDLYNLIFLSCLYFQHSVGAVKFKFSGQIGSSCIYSKRLGSCIHGNIEDCVAGTLEPVSDKEGRKWHCWNKDDVTSCYHFMPDEQINKAEAENTCSQMGAHVVAVETEDEHMAVKDMIISMGYVSLFWIDLHADTIWKHSGESVTYTGWGTGEPLSGVEDCALISENTRMWVDWLCTLKEAVICEKEIVI